MADMPEHFVTRPATGFGTLLLKIVNNGIAMERAFDRALRG